MIVEVMREDKTRVLFSDAKEVELDNKCNSIKLRFKVNKELYDFDYKRNEWKEIRVIND